MSGAEVIRQFFHGRPKCCRSCDGSGLRPVEAEAFIEAALRYVEAHDAYDERMTPANADRMYRARAAFYRLGRAVLNERNEGGGAS